MNLNKLFIGYKENKYVFFRYLIGILLLFISFLLIAKELLSLDFMTLLTMISSQNATEIFSFFIFGVIAVSLISVYDFILRKEFKLDISMKDTFKVAWVSNTIGNFLGEKSTHVGGISYLLYQSEGIDSNKSTFISIIKNTLFINADENEDSDINFLKLSIKARIELILGLLTKWIASACFFIYVLKSFGVTTSLSKMLFIFVAAAGISVLSHIPGGLGIFELVCLYLFIYLGVPTPNALLGILIYRLFYHVVPWLITQFILAIKPKLVDKIKLSPANKRLLQLLSVQATATLILCAGLLLIFSASLPQVLQTTFVSSFTGMGIGLILLILSRGVYNKVKSSYYCSLFFLVLGVIFVLVYGFNMIEALLLILIALVLFSSKECFYREAKRLSLKNFLIGLGIVTGISFAYLSIYVMFLENKLVFDYFRFSDWKEVLVFILIMGASALLLNVVSVRKMDFATPSDEDLEELKEFLTKYEGNSMTHLIFLKDKSLFYTMDKQVLIAFRPYKDNLMVLGDPIGNPALFKDAINEFRIYADRFDMTPIFYEVCEKYLPLYHENGFNFLKLGEEATMSFEDFTYVGKKAASLRTIKNKLTRHEFDFEIVHPPFSEELMETLKTISDSWLQGRHEKVFSLGSFNDEYINRSPVALVKKDDEILGFATILPMYQKHIFSIDLMRLIPDPPNGTMEATFIGIIEWAKEEGYTHFVLGKAPLSNVGINQFSSKKEKIVKHFYNYGNKLYSFKGLRHFKEKFSPEWEGTYLAYPKNTNLSLVIINLARMISGKNENKK